MEQAQKSNIILVPTDFSEVCDNAIEHGLILAKSLNYRVFLIHVINKDTNKYLNEKKLTRESIAQKLDEMTLKYSKEYGVQVEYLIKTGNLFEKVKDIAEKLNIKLIILGTHGKVGFQKLTGSYVLKMIITADVPTIVVQKRSFQNGYKNIIFPITAQARDRQKVSWAVNIAKTFDATIHLIPKYESEKFYKKRIMNITKQIKNLFDEYDVAYTDKVSDPKSGNFAKQVIDYAVVTEAELIMTLVSKDKSFFFNSWDEQLIYNQSQIPVICINPHSKKKAGGGSSWAFQ